MSEDQSQQPVEQPSAESMAGVSEHVRSWLASIREAEQQSAQILGKLMRLGEQGEDIVVSLRESASALSEAVSSAETAQARHAEVSAYMEESRLHAGTVRTSIDSSDASCQQAAASAAVALSKIEAAEQLAEQSSTNAAESRDAAKASAAQAADAHEEALIAARALKGMTTIAEEQSARVSAYEQRLEKLIADCATKLAEIESLLPGAASAGLATAFSDRRKEFLKPSWMWQVVFVGALGTLVYLAMSGLSEIKTEAGAIRDFSELGRLWLSRLPIAGALIWLALHSSREGALAKRLEEDYGYKEAIARSFQGFQKQMADLASDLPEGSPVARLCNDTLSTLAAQPGRIYDKHQLTALPSDSIKELIESTVERTMKTAAPGKAGADA